MLRGQLDDLGNGLAGKVSCSEDEEGQQRLVSQDDERRRRCGRLPALHPHRRGCPTSPPRRIRLPHPPPSGSSCRRCASWGGGARPPSTTRSPVAEGHKRAKVSVSRQLHPHRRRVAHLGGRDVLEGAVLLQVPDDHEASAVANHHLVWVDRALLQGLYVF